MTVSSLNLFNTGVGDGVSLGPFPFTFACSAASQLQVSVNGAVISSSMYTVALNTNSKSTTPAGGSITFLVAPASLAVILMQRIISLTQDVSFGNQSQLNTSVIENALDRAVMAIQGQAILAQLAISLPVGTTGISTVLPAPVANTVIGWDPTATFVTNITFQQILAGVTGVGLGNVVGPSPTVVGEIALYNNTTGTALSRLSPGTAGNVATSAGGVWTSAAPPVVSFAQLRAYLVTAQAEADGSSAGNGTIFIGPYKGNKVTTDNGSGVLTTQTLTEQSAALTVTSGLAYSVYLKWNGAAWVVTVTQDWTGNTPPTYLSDVLGRPTKPADTSNLLVATFYAGATNKVFDWLGERSLSNEYNEIPKPIFAQDTTVSWTYASATFRSSNANTTNGQGRVQCFTRKTRPINLQNYQLATHSATNAIGIGIGVNSTTVPTVHNSATVPGGGSASLSCGYSAAQSVGLSFYQRMEVTQGATATFYYTFAAIWTANGANAMTGIVYQ